MKYLYLTLFFLWINTPLFPQTTVTYDLESGIEELEIKHKESWEKIKEIDGFRIQLFASAGVNSRNTVEEIHDEFVRKFPKIPAYVGYSEPYFRLRVGDFKTKLEAYKILREIRLSYTGAFIIKDQISFR
ncbi:MAG TPA: SPOR domain-containing protein [Bacteroidales bacterium]|nr:SPOR domain-containing protein [Bacteroidales bacterium]